jgi:hypothetical protein
MTKKVQSISELFNQVKILTKEPETEEKEELETEVDENEEAEEESDEESDEDGDDETEADESDESDEDGDEESETEEESEEETDESDESDEDGDDETESEDEAENENGIAELSEKVDALASDFNKFKGKMVSLLEAILAANRINLGLKETETPRLTVEKKKEGTLNTASGKLKHEVAALELYMNEDASLKITSKDKVISKGTAVENPLEIKGKVPLGNWIVVERKEKYYLVSADNFEEAEDVAPYEDDNDNEEPAKGQVVNKKGVANNVRGYVLKNCEDCFKLTDASLEKPVKVFNAKWNSDCDNQWPVKGNIPEGVWVIVYSNDEDKFYLVKSDDVEPKVSTKKTEKTEKKVAVKKVAAKKVTASKKPAKKEVKKVAKKKNKK